MIHSGHLGVSKNRGTPKSSILIGFSIINHPFGGTPIFGNTHLLRKGHQTNALRQMVAVRRETQDGGRLGER